MDCHLQGGSRAAAEATPSRWRGQQKDLKCQWRGREAERVIFPAREGSEQAQDMLPGPYPKTLEEQVAIAKKYNMQVEDEEPWLDDGMG
uniref:Uncharacterized protein n=1 Tax=Capra hircus TaxID=9925 RepID=A0A8C2NRR0_CAPHI